MGNSTLRGLAAAEALTNGCDWSANDLAVCKAINDVINYVLLTGQHPASVKWLGRWFPLMRQLVEQRCIVICGVRLMDLDPPITDDILREQWECNRKHGYKMLKRHQPIQTDVRPLFENVSVGAVVYVYHGKVASENGRLIKIGYTAQDLKKYLSGKRLSHDPVLLASMPGDKNVEDDLHRKFNYLLSAGREWFQPDRGLFEFIKRHMQLAPGFESETQNLMMQQQSN